MMMIRISRETAVGAPRPREGEALPDLVSPIKSGKPNQWNSAAFPATAGPGRSDTAFQWTLSVDDMSRNALGRADYFGSLDTKQAAGLMNAQRETNLVANLLLKNRRWLTSD